MRGQYSTPVNTVGTEETIRVIGKGDFAAVRALPMCHSEDVCPGAPNDLFEILCRRSGHRLPPMPDGGNGRTCAFPQWPSGRDIGPMELRRSRIPGESGGGIARSGAATSARRRNTEGVAALPPCRRPVVCRDAACPAGRKRRRGTGLQLCRTARGHLQDRKRVAGCQERRRREAGRVRRKLERPRVLVSEGRPFAGRGRHSPTRWLGPS